MMEFCTRTGLSSPAIYLIIQLYHQGIMNIYFILCIVIHKLFCSEHPAVALRNFWLLCPFLDSPNYVLISEQEEKKKKTQATQKPCVWLTCPLDTPFSTPGLRSAPGLANPVPRTYKLLIKAVSHDAFEVELHPLSISYDHGHRGGWAWQLVYPGCIGKRT